MFGFWHANARDVCKYIILCLPDNPCDFRIVPAQLRADRSSFERIANTEFEVPVSRHFGDNGTAVKSRARFYEGLRPYALLLRRTDGQ
jgi:hypothetical protein